MTCLEPDDQETMIRQIRICIHVFTCSLPSDIIRDEVLDVTWRRKIAVAPNARNASDHRAEPATLGVDSIFVCQGVVWRRV